MVSSEFISKIEFACKKKESLYSKSKFKYAIRSMFAGAFLTFSTAAGAVGADLINKIAPTAPAAVLKVKKAPANIERIAYLNLL